MSRDLAAMPFADVYPHYVRKVERKGRTVAELHAVIAWLTGFSEKEIKAHSCCRHVAIPIDSSSAWCDAISQRSAWRWRDRGVVVAWHSNVAD